MDLRKLRYFVMTAEEQHMNRAAARLHVSQPALSQQIKDLEDEIGVQLFDRLPRGMRLTHAGKTLLEDARRILADVEQATERVRRAERGELGSLRIGFNEIAGQQHIVAQTLHYFRQTCPAVDLTMVPLTTHEQIEALLAGRIDAGFQYNQGQANEQIDLTLIREDECLLMLPRQHRLAVAAEVQPADLRDEPFVWMSRKVNPMLHDRLIAFCLAAGFSPRIVQEAQNDLSHINLVSVGMGLGFGVSAPRWGQSDAVAMRRVSGLHLPLAFSLAWRRDDAAPHLQRFIATLQELVAAPESP